MSADQRDREIEALRERLSRLSEASLRINESLDFDTVLRAVMGVRPRLFAVGRQRPPDKVETPTTTAGVSALCICPRPIGAFDTPEGRR